VTDAAASDFQVALKRGLLLFDGGDFHAAHDAFEAGWRAGRGDRKRLLQVLVLWAAAFYQAERGKRLGAQRLIRRALERAAALPSALGQLDLEALRDVLVESLSQLARPEGPLLPVAPRWAPVLPATGPASIDFTHTQLCPWCGEPVAITIALENTEGAVYSEDCPVCCRPWRVKVTLEEDSPRVQLDREDE
jgi:predicted metal-dependent hydrolase